MKQGNLLNIILKIYTALIINYYKYIQRACSLIAFNTGVFK